MASVRVRFRVRDIGVNIAGHLYLRLDVTIATAYSKFNDDDGMNDYDENVYIHIFV